MELERQIDLGKDILWSWLVLEEARRNPKGSTDLVCLTDGQLSLWNARTNDLRREDAVGH